MVCQSCADNVENEYKSKQIKAMEKTETMENNSCMQLDKEILPAKYFAEDDTMRSIGKYPEYVGTMMICIDSLENGVAQGRLHTYYQKDLIPFFSLDQMLLAMEDVLNQVGTPQAWTEARSFTKAKNKRSEDVEKKEIVQKISPFYDLQMMRPQRGRIASFYIRVYSRMNSSMQGVVQVAGISEKVAFRSELELLHLIYEGVSLPKKNSQKAEVQNER